MIRSCSSVACLQWRTRRTCTPSAARGTCGTTLLRWVSFYVVSLACSNENYYHHTHVQLLEYYRPWSFMRLLVLSCSRDVLAVVGNQAVPGRQEGTVWIQRKSIHQLGNLQRNSVDIFPQHFNVSLQSSILYAAYIVHHDVSKLDLLRHKKWICSGFKESSSEQRSNSIKYYTRLIIALLNVGCHKRTLGAR